jgi:glycosyltransferase involved in cell wall biosynthesis
MSAPLLRIGLPVYNGERFLAHTLDSLLCQTFENFELYISDNGSTDATESICRHYCKLDSRIAYIRHGSNRGAAFNWNFVVAGCQSKWFKWASSNDYCAPEFLASCIEVLIANTDVALCYTRTHLVDSEGRLIEIDSQDFSAMEESPSARFLKLMDHGGRNNAQAGVIRFDSLRKTRLERSYPHGDKVLMAELAAQGKFWLIDTPLFYRRFDSGTSSVSSLTADGLREYITPATEGNSVRFDYWSRQIDFLFSAFRSVRGWRRFPLLMQVLRRIFGRRRALLEELRDARFR